MARILIIDDQPGMLSLLREMLESEDHEVVEASDGAMAIRWWQEHSYDQPIDLIVTDMLMPDGDGIEVIRHIRQASPKTKVIAISGDSPFVNISLLDIARRMGAFRTISKPFTMATLLTAVRAALEVKDTVVTSR
jgi:two-component system response regulator (stage 0 sporulation protein F)